MEMETEQSLHRAREDMEDHDVICLKKEHSLFNYWWNQIKVAVVMVYELSYRVYISFYV